MAIADLPYLHAAGDGGPRPMTQMVVIHATDNTASASAEASYATRRPDRTSAHIYADGTSAYRALSLGNVAYGCHPTGNSRSVQFELCGRSNQISDATLRQAAPLVAEVCRMYGIPVRKVSPAELVNGAKGICGHIDVTNAWHEGDHTDPGASFPWATFISYVQAAATGGTVTSPMSLDQARKAANADAYGWGYVAELDPIPGVLGGDGVAIKPGVPNKPLQRAQRIEKAVTETLPKLIKDSVAGVQAGGQPTQEQVNSAVLAAMLDPRVQEGIGDAIASHLHVS